MKNNSNKNFIAYLCISYIFFISLPILIGGGLDRSESYLVVLISAFLSMAYLIYKFNRLFEVNFTVIVIVGFTVKLLIGYIFWEFYIFPDYFSDEKGVPQFQHYEYLVFEKWMADIADYRINNGFLSISEGQVIEQGKYFYITYIMSNLYMSGNFNVLDLSIQNSLYTVYTAIIISLIAMRFGSTRLQTKIVFIIALFQPSTFISTIIWRDFLGQFYVIFGIYLLLISFNVRTMKAIAMVTTSSLLMSLYRNVYIFFPVMLYFLMYFRVGMKSLRKNLISFFLMISVVFTVYTSKLMLSMNDGYSSYFDGISIKLILFIPINFIRNLIGPFPWTNWFEFNDNTIFLIGDYLQSVYVLAIIYFTVKYYKLNASDFKFYLVAFFIGMLILSLATPDIHTTYFSFAAVLMLPISYKYLTLKRFYSVYSVIFVGYILLNIVFLSSGLSGQGVGAIFR